MDVRRRPLELAERRRDAWCVAGLLLLVLLLFADALFSGANFYLRDLYRYHFPMKAVVRATIEAGELPWWNRFISAGQPMAANPAYEIFYPPQWLIFAGSFPFGFALHIVAHVALALVGMFVLLRRALRIEAALLGALSFGLGSYLLSSTTNLPMMFVWSWAPLIGALLLRWLERRSARAFALLAIAAGVQAVIGEPVALLECWTLLAMAVWWHQRSVVRTALRVGAVAAAAILIAAVQLVPMLDHARDSARARGFAFDTVVDYSTSPLRLAELFDPDVVRHAGGAPRRAPSGSFTPQTHYVPSFYCGLTIVLFALAGWFSRLRGGVLAGVIAAACLLLAMGDRTPLFRWLYDAHVIRSIRYPEKFIAAGLFATIVFGAYAAARFLDGDARLRRAAPRAALATLVVVVAIAATGRHAARGSAAVWVPIALTAAWLLLLVLRARAERRGAVTLWNALALLLIVGDVALRAGIAAPRAPAALFVEPEIVSAFDRDRAAYSVFDRRTWLSSESQSKWALVPSLFVQRNSLRPFMPNTFGLRGALEFDYDETDLLPTHDLIDAMKRYATTTPNWSEPFVSMANVRYIIDDADFDTAVQQTHGDAAHALPIRVRRLSQSPPRYFFARRIVEVHDSGELVRALQRDARTLGAAYVPIVPFDPAPARLLRVHETSSAAELDVESSGRALLVMTVTRHKYWRITIDGAEVPVVPANLAFQSIVVPAGRHRVAMRYRNPLVIVGGAISLVALLACAGALVLPPQARRPQAAEPPHE